METVGSESRSDVVNLVKNDQKLVRDLATLLKPGGILILTTPYKHHKAYYGEALSSTEDGGHVRWGYTHDELRRDFRYAIRGSRPEAPPMPSLSGWARGTPVDWMPYRS